MLAVTGAALGCDSEVGTLRVVILHRPGPELQRLTPRNNDTLLFDGLPWVAKAQEEHDAFAELLRSRGVEVLLLGEPTTGNPPIRLVFHDYRPQSHYNAVLPGP